MPWTAGAFLVGAAAISALPPLNGFVSEWLTFQSLLSLGINSGGATAVVAAVCAGALALTGGLAAFCFVKAFGIAFLGMPRTPAAEGAVEARGSMLVSMFFLAALCLALGVLSPRVLDLITPVTLQLAGARADVSVGIVPAATGVAAVSRATLAPAAALAGLVALGLLTWLLGRALGGGPLRTRKAPPWVCGIAMEPGMQYSASALAKPIRVIFSVLVRPYREIVREYSAGGDRYFVSSVHYEAGVHPVYERHLYRPLLSVLLRSAGWIRGIQSGSLRAYLAYMIATLIVVLLLTR
jgi:hydrogenase-4 component B